MKYIDKGLSPENIALLNAWIDRRESGQNFVDARSAEDRKWWEAQQAFIHFNRNPPPLQSMNPYMQSQWSDQQQQSIMNAMMGISGANQWTTSNSSGSSSPVVWK